MGGRTYIPQLLKILSTVCKYIIRYRSQLVEHLPPEAVGPLDNVVTACNALTAVIPPLEIGD